LSIEHTGIKTSTETDEELKNLNRLRISLIKIVIYIIYIFKS